MKYFFLRQTILSDTFNLFSLFIDLLRLKNACFLFKPSCIRSSLAITLLINLKFDQVLFKISTSK